MNPLRHQFIKKCRAAVASESIPLKQGQEQRQIQGQGHKGGLHYLDVGCGGGIFSESAARMHDTASVTGIDPSPEVLSVAKRHARRDPRLMEPGRLTYLPYSIEDLPLPPSEAPQRSETPAAISSIAASQPQKQQWVPPPGGYDTISLFEVIEHVNQPSKFLASCIPHLKPGGWLVLSTIARTYTSYFLTKTMAEYVLGLVPRGTHDWEKYVNPGELGEWFGKDERKEMFGPPVLMGVVYVPGLGWREVSGSEAWGNYFFGVQKRA